jgi:hypothetical protein
MGPAWPDLDIDKSGRAGEPKVTSSSIRRWRGLLMERLRAGLPELVSSRG